MYQSSGLSIRTPGLRKRDQGRRGPLLDKSVGLKAMNIKEKRTLSQDLSHYLEFMELIKNEYDWFQEQDKKSVGRTP